MFKIGYIGLGIMGRPMAENLLAAGYPLAVYSRRPESANGLVEKGAVYFNTPKELAETVDIIITNVTATADVEEVLIGKKESSIRLGLIPLYRHEHNIGKCYKKIRRIAR